MRYEPETAGRDEARYERLVGLVVDEMVRLVKLGIRPDTSDPDAYSDWLASVVSDSLPNSEDRDFVASAGFRGAEIRRQYEAVAAKHGSPAVSEAARFGRLAGIRKK